LSDHGGLDGQSKTGPADPGCDAVPAFVRKFDPLKSTAGNNRYQIAKRAARVSTSTRFVYEAELSEALGYLNRAGLRPRNTRLWQLPYYSPYQRMKVALIELENVEPVNQPAAR